MLSFIVLTLRINQNGRSLAMSILVVTVYVWVVVYSLKGTTILSGVSPALCPVTLRIGSRPTMSQYCPTMFQYCPIMSQDWVISMLLFSRVTWKMALLLGNQTGSVVSDTMTWGTHNRSVSLDEPLSTHPADRNTSPFLFKALTDLLELAQALIHPGALSCMQCWTLGVISWWFNLAILTDYGARFQGDETFLG